MKTKRTLAGIGALMISLAAPALADELTSSVWFPDTHPLARAGHMALAEDLENRSGGNFKLTVFTGTALLPPVAHLSGLKDGIVQMTYHAGTYTPSDLPEDNLLSALAIGLDDPMTAALAAADFYINDPAMRSMFDRHDIVFLGAYSTPQYQLMCSREVTTLDQIRGAKLRMPSLIHTAWGSEIGASSVSVPSSEMYTGLEKGQLDCAVNALNDLKSRSLWDVAKYVTTLELGPYFAGWLYAIDRRAWIELSPEGRRLLIDAVSDNSVDTTIAYQVSADEAVSEAEANGVKISAPSDDLQDSLDQFLAAKGLAAAKDIGEKLGVEDVDGVIERYQETYDKWSQILQGVDRYDAAALKEILHKEVYSNIDTERYGHVN